MPSTPGPQLPGFIGSSAGTCTVLLAADASSVVGVRLAPGGQIGWVPGGSGARLLRLQVLDAGALAIGEPLGPLRGPFASLPPLVNTISSASLRKVPIVSAAPTGTARISRSGLGRRTPRSAARTETTRAQLAADWGHEDLESSLREPPAPLHGHRVAEITIAVGSPAAGHRLGYVAWPPGCTPVSLLRGGRLRAANPVTILRHGDRVSLLVPAPGRPARTSDGTVSAAGSAAPVDSFAPISTTSPDASEVPGWRVTAPLTRTRPPASICFRVRPDASANRCARHSARVVDAETVWRAGGG